VDLRRIKKSKKGRKPARAEGSAPAKDGGDTLPAPAPEAEVAATPAATADPVADAVAGQDAGARQDPVAIAEALLAAAAEKAEIAEAMYRSALRRAELAEAKERSAAERSLAIEAREQAALERDELAVARDRAAAERDEIANRRDRAAAKRDKIANARLAKARTAPAPAAKHTDDEELEKARLEAELQRAHLDALTGAFRREVGRLALRNEIERARRADGKFVIAFIDVDGLKGVNDRDGHAAGDRVLRMLGATIRANLRSYDPIVRYGGDEFVCGIASIDPSEVQHRIGVIDQSLRHATGVGITAGLATLTSNESLDELTAKADAALLEAKRNRGE
jgi:diguanylate cyclase (GGDEF)-like protein